MVMIKVLVNDNGEFFGVFECEEELDEKLESIEANEQFGTYTLLSIEADYTTIDFLVDSILSLMNSDEFVDEDLVRQTIKKFTVDSEEIQVNG